MEKIKNILKNKIAIITLIIIVLTIISGAIIYATISLKRDEQANADVVEDEEISIEELTQADDVINVIIEENIEKQEEISNVQENPLEHQTYRVEDPHTYYIQINCQANVVNIYAKDEYGEYTVPVKAMVCSTGTATPESGKYRVKNRWRWLELLGNVYGQYSTQIVGNILFHSVPYLEKNNPASLEYWEYDKLGTRCSAGCIRLTVADAKWIYNNISQGTIVEFYSDADPGPIGKPASQKISNNEANRNWDPTDDTEGNPWKNWKEENNTENKNVVNNTTNNTANNIVNNTKNNVVNNTKDKEINNVVNNTVSNFVNNMSSNTIKNTINNTTDDKVNNNATNKNVSQNKVNSIKSNTTLNNKID